MAETDGLELPVGLTEKAFLQQVARLETRLAKMEGETVARFKKVNSGVAASFADLERQASRSFKSIAAAPLAALSAALGGRQLIAMAGQWTDLTSRVNLAAGSMDKGADVMARVSEMARRTYSSLTQTTEGYLAFSRVLGDLGVATGKQLDFVESLNNALVVSGAKGDTAARVMDALAKAMALGKLQGDNLNTVIASGGRVAQALAESMGVTSLQLRKLGTDGKIGRAELLNITSQMEKLRSEAAEMPATIQDGFTLLNNALLEYIGRGDEATGISAAIADALVIIADNFDAVADTALKAAAVIATAFLGRSVAGMLVGLGSATKAVTGFVKALSGVSTVGGFGAAMGKLSLAAGPLGMILGGVVAGGALLYADAARKAKEETDLVTAELTRLGLIAPRAKEVVDGVSEALTSLSSGERRKQLEAITNELNRMGESPIWGVLRSGKIGETFHAIWNEANKGTGIGRSVLTDFLEEDKPALAQIERLALALKDGKMFAVEAAAEIERIGQMDMSRPARDLLQRLDDLAQRKVAAEIVMISEGQLDNLDLAWTMIDAIIGAMVKAGVSPEAIGGVRELGDEIIRTGEVSESAMESLAALADVHVDAQGYIAQLQPIFSALRGLIAQVEQAKAVAGMGTGPALSEGQVSAYAEYGASRRAGVEAARLQEEFIAGQARLQNMTREQIALEREKEKVRKDALAAGVELTESQVSGIAEGNVAADAGRGGRGGGGKKGQGNPKLERLIEDLQTEREIEMERYEDSLKLLEEASAKELEILGGYAAAKERLEQDHQDRMAAIKEAANEFSLRSALGAGAEVLGAMGAFNKKALKVSQAFAAAEALVSAYQGAAKELKNGKLGFATAAAVLAKGISFVAAIKGISADGGGGGGRGGGGSSAPAAAAAAPLPVQRLDWVWHGPQAAMPGMQDFASYINEMGARGYRIDAKVVAPPT